MDNKWDLFQKFLITEEVQVSIEDFLLGAVILVILSIILEFTYMKCAKSLSNRKVFAGNFLLLAFTTMLIISIVKSSLALSLGLVGALSIVRFRAAIKEPEELTYLFISIAIGLGLGANQHLIVVVAFIIMSVIIWARYFLSPKSRSQNLLFSVSGHPGDKVDLDAVTEILGKHFRKFELKRFDENQDVIEMSFVLDTSNSKALSECKNDLKALSNKLNVTFLDNNSY
ncbi:MAG TPA: DUF4956 domain-containing protein [Bacteroidales bacterium]|nr:DUF4956 domain-containing protein [Bacteroidales bacterium]